MNDESGELILDSSFILHPSSLGTPYPFFQVTPPLRMDVQLSGRW
jgi:hypothetical protein